MIKLGLTGSIGMGKTTTALMFKTAGCPVFDADKTVHKLYAKGGEAVSLIKAVFPDAIKAQAVDRTILGAHMRADPLNLTVLESFIHPMVRQKRVEFIQRSKKQGADIIIFDVPLLFETGGAAYVDKTILVTAPFSLQRERVLARANMTESLFQTLLSRQMPDRKKRELADYLIFTDRGMDVAREQVQDILCKIRNDKISK